MGFGVDDPIRNHPREPAQPIDVQRPFSFKESGRTVAPPTLAVVSESGTGPLNAHQRFKRRHANITPRDGGRPFARETTGRFSVGFSSRRSRSAIGRATHGLPARVGHAWRLECRRRALRTRRQPRQTSDAVAAHQCSGPRTKTWTSEARSGGRCVGGVMKIQAPSVTGQPDEKAATHQQENVAVIVNLILNTTRSLGIDAIYS